MSFSNRCFATCIAMFMALTTACRTTQPQAEGSSVKDLEDAEVAEGWVIEILGSPQDTFRASIKEPGRAVSLVECATELKSAYGYRLRCEQRPRSFEVVFNRQGTTGAVVLKARSSGEKKTLALACAGEGGPRKMLRCQPKQVDFGERRGLVSPIRNSFTDVQLPNTHVVRKTDAGEPLLLRSMNPQTSRDYDEFQRLGVKRVLIFKNQVRTEVDTEVTRLEEFGVKGDQIERIPFLYKDFANFESPCRQTIAALKFLGEGIKRRQPTLFHCTVGEDRTGVLSALTRMLYDGYDLQKAFQEEMCEFGYSSGNPQKPLREVILGIDADLTPFLLKMAYKIQSGTLTAENLNAETCRIDPAKSREYRRDARYDAKRYRCGASTRYYPWAN